MKVLNFPAPRQVPQLYEQLKVDPVLRRVVRAYRRARIEVLQLRELERRARRVERVA